MTRLLNAAGLMAAAWLVLIQRDVDGDLLVNGWHGLGYLTLALMGAAIYQAARGMAKRD